MDLVDKEIDRMAEMLPQTRKVFLADGNAMVLSFSKLENILDKLRCRFDHLVRVSAYATPSDLQNKTDEELKLLERKGLKLLYVGIETGNEELLTRINKGETRESIRINLVKARKAGIKLSVMILTGLGGKQLSEEHARDSANIVNEIQPEYLSTLVLSYPYGLDHFRSRFAGDFEPLDLSGLLNEQFLFLNETALDKTVFRSDHASNYLVLKGILGRDKSQLLDKLKQSINDPFHPEIRAEWMRGL